MLKDKSNLTNVTNWVDYNCYAWKNKVLLLEDNIITCTSRSLIFGYQKLDRKSSFTVIFNKIRSLAGIGIIDSKYNRDHDLIAV